MSKLVIVESPAKAKTIKKYLGSGFEVEASMGHIRDLPEKRLAVDVGNNFKPEYVEMDSKKEIIKKLKMLSDRANQVYLATDPDREGEAISWHLAHILDINQKEPVRVTFNEITQRAVTEGISNPRAINENLVNAQQARRVLDRLVGYKLSPFLWKKVKKGLSAGRVQSVAALLVVEREREIKEFVPEEYWNLFAKLLKGKKAFTSRFYGDKNKKITLGSENECSDIIQKLSVAKYIVSDVKNSSKVRNPAPPFITASLQQEASRKYGFSSKNTMRIAQQLYEGIDIKDMGMTGLITYMRTDSLRISDEATDAARQFIKEHYGNEYLPQTAKKYKTKKNAQDAHEAIRPTYINLAPSEIKDSLTKDQYKLYKLIWERFIASQMSSAVYDVVNVEISAGDYIFKASDQKIKFSGFTVLYEESEDTEEEQSDKLPPLNIGDELKLQELIPEQKFTAPPQRYTEATLIKALEENGIGRPSTYAPIISTILDRGYVEKEGKSLKATELGFITTDLMKNHFKNIVDVEFTASLEKKLDNIEDGKVDWVKIVSDFYKPFEESIKKAEEELKNKKFKVPEVESDEICEKCGRKMVIRTGRFGKFLACPGYPACKNAKPIIEATTGECPKCKGKIIARKSKRGRKFFGCENYPKCDFVTWDKPISEKCPDCRSTLLKKNGKAKKIYCSAICGYERNE